MRCEVLSVNEEEEVLLVQLENSPFKAASGGQPSDLGIIKTKDFIGKVTEVLYDNLVEVRPEKGKLEPGVVECDIDKKRRKNLSKMHTAQHILYKCLEDVLDNLELVKINLAEDKSHLFVKTDVLDWSLLLKAEEKANEVIKEGKSIRSYKIKKSEVKNRPLLRIKEDKIKDDMVTVVEIQDFDQSACSGSHCRKTSDVGWLFISDFKSAGKGKYDITFLLDPVEEMYDLTKIARLSSGILGIEIEKLPSILNNMKNEVQGYKSMVRKQKIDAEEELLGSLSFLHNTFENVQNKELILAAKKLVHENSVLVLVNKKDGASDFLIFVSDDLSIDAEELVNKIKEKFGGKGGGKKEQAMCSIEEKPEEVMDFIKESLNPKV